MAPRQRHQKFVVDFFASVLDCPSNKVYVNMSYRSHRELPQVAEFSTFIYLIIRNGMIMKIN